MHKHNGIMVMSAHPHTVKKDVVTVTPKALGVTATHF